MMMKKLAKKFEKLVHHKWLFSLIIAVISAFLAFIFAWAFDNLELQSYDTRFAIRGAMEVEQDNIVIVGIDDQTFSTLNIKWPFPRALYARAILNLAEAGARLIVVDIEFLEASAPANSRQDVLLAGAIKRAGNVVLAGSLIKELGPNNTFNSYPEKPLQMFLDAGAKWSMINTSRDDDGFIRRYMLFQQHNNQPYLSMSVQVQQMLRFGFNGIKKIVLDEDGNFILGDQRIPKIDHNSMLINFRGPAKTFPTYSLSSIIDDEKMNLGEDDTDIFEIHKLEGTFKDKIVFIGATSEVLQDTKFTPFFNYQGRTRKLPGVELHANALSTLLRGDYIKTENALVGILMVFLLAGLAALTTKWLNPLKGFVGIATLILLYFIISIYLFNHHLLWIEITGPSFAIMLSYVGNVVHTTLTERRERVRIKKSWQQYMSKDVIDAMLSSGELPTYGGERKELTILFSDIRGFTTFSEKHSADVVVKKLQEYLTDMVDVIFQYKGTLDKFVGDEIMAVFGAPYFYKEHAEKACYTALEMMKRLGHIQKKWSANNEDYFNIGIGINSGKVISGNLGASQHFDYTVIGDEVNLGARLEGANKQYGTAIIISESTYKLVKKKAKVRELDLVRVKGKKKPVRIFELRAMENLPRIEQELIVDTYTMGLNYYKQYKWYQALKEFKRVIRYFPTDGPSRVYIKRCLDFMEAPPMENWDGVYEFTTK